MVYYLSASEMNALKARVDAELTRRNGYNAMQGHVQGYVHPLAAGEFIYEEHFLKPIQEMRAINPAGLPVSNEPEALMSRQLFFDALQTRLVANELIPRSNRGTSDCASACSGMCVTQCTSTCWSACGGNCIGGCGGGCLGTCYGGCNTGCTSSCGGNCSGSCDGSCSGTCVSCSGTCHATCSGPWN